MYCVAVAVICNLLSQPELSVDVGVPSLTHRSTHRLTCCEAIAIWWPRGAFMILHTSRATLPCSLQPDDNN